MQRTFENIPVVGSLIPCSEVIVRIYTVPETDIFQNYLELFLGPTVTRYEYLFNITITSQHLGDES